MTHPSRKRNFADYDAGGSSEPAEHAHKNKKSKGSKKATVKATSLNSVKGRARTIERLFKSGQEIPQDVRNELERELAHHRQKIAKLADDKKRKTMITKYHMVRFFERKKADRLAKQLRSQLESATADDDVKKLEANLHKAEIDGLYARFFPHREAYISLYSTRDDTATTDEKRGEGNSASQFLQAGRPAIWKDIEKAAKEGTRALTAIRERKSEEEPRPTSRSVPKKAPEVVTKRARREEAAANVPAVAQPVAGNRRERRKLLAAQPKKPATGDDDDSDGGFFDEG